MKSDWSRLNAQVKSDWSGLNAQHSGLNLMEIEERGKGGREKKEEEVEK